MERERILISTSTGDACPGELPPLDRVVFQSHSVRVGAFRCPAWHPRFRDSGPIQNDVFVFPRRSVRLCHEGGSAFLADPSVVTLYNRGQRYSRSVVTAAGDDCDWFAVERSLFFDAVRSFDPSVEDRPEHPLRWTHGPCDSRTYLAQRVLFDRLSTGEIRDPLRVEETVLRLLFDVLACARAFWGTTKSPPRASRGEREAAEHARSFLSTRLGEPLSLSDIAQEVGVSVFRLCKAFRTATGSTLHAYRNRMRLQTALERLSGGENLTEIAFDLGYSSHSHFTAAFRKHFGLTPSSVRHTRQDTTWVQFRGIVGSPYENRTRISALRGPRPNR
jgi:AraC family transcriptional regulator